MGLSGRIQCGSAAVKYIVYNVYRFIEIIGCIIDQSNWSGPFSLVVMTPDFHPGDGIGQLWLDVFG